MTRYELGYMRKCAEYGLDGRWVYKTAQAANNAILPRGESPVVKFLRERGIIGPATNTPSLSPWHPGYRPPNGGFPLELPPVNQPVKPAQPVQPEQPATGTQGGGDRSIKERVLGAAKKFRDMMRNGPRGSIINEKNPLAM